MKRIVYLPDPTILFYFPSKEFDYNTPIYNSYEVAKENKAILLKRLIHITDTNGIDINKAFLTFEEKFKARNEAYFSYMLNNIHLYEIMEFEDD